MVWRLANPLGVPLVELLGGAATAAAPAMGFVPAHGAPSRRSLGGLCELRILGPIELAVQFELYALTVQAGGALEVTAGDRTQRLKPGETARYAADRPNAIRNTAKTPASGWLVVVHPA